MNNKTLVKTYVEVNKRLKELNLNLLWQDFKLYPFAIYNSESICLEGKILPYNDKFIGNTAIEYENSFIAIWNIEMSPIEDLEILAAKIIHEMFHCYQKENKETRYANDLKLLMYPLSIKNYSLKYYENQALLNALKEENSIITKQYLVDFFTFRKLRQTLINDFINLEYKVETIEGLAEYVGLKALRQLSLEKYNKEIENVLSHLKVKEESLDVRRISYYVGVVFFLVLEKIKVNIDKYKLTETKTIYELFSFDAPKTYNLTDFDYSDFKEIIENEKNRKSQIINKFKDFPNIQVIDYKIIGYDPMNMFRLNNYIYCSHFIALSKDDDYKIIKEKVLLTMKENSINEVIAYKLIK